jgi:hypothetical protein
MYFKKGKKCSYKCASCDVNGECIECSENR